MCADVIDLRERLEQFQGLTPKTVPKVATVFQLLEINPETQRPFEPSVEKTVTFGPASGLRKFLSQWRGERPPVDQQPHHLPPIERGLSAGTLSLHGWVYDLAHGDVRVFDGKTEEFVAASRLG